MQKKIEWSFDYQNSVIDIWLQHSLSACDLNANTLFFFRFLSCFECSKSLMLFFRLLDYLTWKYFRDTTHTHKHTHSAWIVWFTLYDNTLFASFFFAAAKCSNWDDISVLLAIARCVCSNVRYTLYLCVSLSSSIPFFFLFLSLFIRIHKLP